MKIFGLGAIGITLAHWAYAEKTYQYKFTPTTEATNSQAIPSGGVKEKAMDWDASLSPFFASRAARDAQTSDKKSLQGILLGVGTDLGEHWDWGGLLGSTFAVQKGENDNAFFLLGEIRGKLLHSSFHSLGLGLGVNTLQAAEGNFASLHGVVSERLRVSEKWHACLEGRANLGFWMASAGASLLW